VNIVLINFLNKILSFLSFSFDLFLTLNVVKFYSVNQFGFLPPCPSDEEELQVGNIFQHQHFSIKYIGLKTQFTLV